MYSVDAELQGVRRGGIWSLAGLCVLLCVGLWPPGATAEPAPVPVFDLHVDLSYQVNYKQRALDRGRGRYLARDLLRSGVSSVVLPLYIPRNASPKGPLMKHLLESHSVMRRGLARTAPYAATGCQGQPVETHFAFEGAAPLGRKLKSVEQWVKRGVSIFGLIHVYDNELGASSTERRAKPNDHGLTRRGKELVRRVHARGGVIDVSHMSKNATADVLQQAEAAGVPVIATHSNAYALAPHHRNLTDAQLRRIAKTGGLIGINFHSRFLLGGAGTATLSDVVRHVAHVVRIAGEEHVAIGSDFEGGIRPPTALKDVRGFPKLAGALSAAGYSRATVRRIFHDNAQRVLCGKEARRGPDAL